MIVRKQEKYAILRSRQHINIKDCSIKICYNHSTKSQCVPYMFNVEALMNYYSSLTKIEYNSIKNRRKTSQYSKTKLLRVYRKNQVNADSRSLSKTEEVAQASVFQLLAPMPLVNRGASDSIFPKWTPLIIICGIGMAWQGVGRIFHLPIGFPPPFFPGKPKNTYNQNKSNILAMKNYNFKTSLLTLFSIRLTVCCLIQKFWSCH